MALRQLTPFVLDATCEDMALRQLTSFVLAGGHLSLGHACEAPRELGHACDAPRELGHACDAKNCEKGKPMIQQDETQTAHTQPLMTGFIKAITAGAKYGFIRMNDGSDIFVMPSSCTGFENKIPPIGTRVTFETRYDSRSKKEKAIFVQPEIAEHRGGWRDHGKYFAASPIGA